MGRFAGEFGDEILMWNDEVSRAAGVALTRRRAAHAFGRFARGVFVASGALDDLTIAPHLRSGARTESLVRFSNFQRKLSEPDVKGFAVKFCPTDAATSDLVAMSADRFLVDSVEGFRILGELTATPVWRIARRGNLGRRLLLNGVSVPAGITLHRAQRRGPFALLRSRDPDHFHTTYHAVHTFILVNDRGAKRAVRFRWAPLATNPSFGSPLGASGTVGFDLNVDLLDARWSGINSAMRTPPKEFITGSLVAGRLTIDRWDPDLPADPAQPDAVSFNPLRLPPGIDPSDDEILFARAAAYPISHQRRQPNVDWHESVVPAPARLSLRARGLRRMLKLLIPGPGTPLDKQRQRLAAIELMPRPRRERYESISLAGVAGLRSTPKHGPPTRHLLHLHGGGYALGSARSHIVMATLLGRRCHAATTVVEYRLAPENPYPAAIDDALAAYHALVQQVPADTIAITGDSAGGGAVVATLVAARDRGLPLPGCAVLFSPWTDLTSSGESITLNAGIDPMIDVASLHEMAAYYAGADHDLADPGVSPLFADLSGLPPIYIQAGSAETLLSDSTRLAARLRAAGGTVELTVADGMWHDFPALAPLFPEANRALDGAAAFICRHTG